MVHRLRVTAIPFLMLATGSACATQEPSASETRPPAASAQASLAQLPPPPPPAIIGQHLIAFGLSLPPDLKPAPAAPGVYRFEGDYPASYLVTSVSEQTRSQPATEPAEAKLFRKVRATKNAGDAPLVSVRIGALDTARSFVDIWLEVDPNRPSKAGVGKSRTWVSGQADGFNKARASSSDLEAIRKRRAAARLAAEKAAAGQPMTPEELDLVR